MFLDLLSCRIKKVLTEFFSYLRLRISIPEDDVDVASMIFVLSAIHPEKFISALENVASVLKTGGFLIFRDYGLYDMAQIRFGKGNKLAENFYVRQDGTRYA